MDLVALFTSAAGQIVDDAAAALDRSHLRHYESTDPDERRQRLQRLFDIVVDCLRHRDLVPVVEYAERVAEERFDAGYDISEVQTAFNVLEEAMWQQVVDATPPVELADAIGLLTTVLGAGKDGLARRYVSLATKTHVPSLDLTALFRGRAI